MVELTLYDANKHLALNLEDSLLAFLTGDILLF